MADSYKHHVMLQAVVGVVIHGIVTAVPGPSVYYIEDSERQFFMAPNLTFSQQKATVVLSAYNHCECRDFCFALGPTACQAWSVTESTQGNYWECRITNIGPETTVLLPDPKATYHFRKSSVLGTYSWQADKLFYVALRGNCTSDAAKARCAKIPGHRLIIVKSRQTYEFFGNLSTKNEKPLWVANLRKVTLTEFRWGDGSISSVTNGTIIINDGLLGTSFVSFNNKIDDSIESRDGPYRALCQANPLGVEW
ncbi:uncharacterized protein [Macrobrachium rosenbergii]|uniref:uncharacterized protein n=1 Tax=Macrobrachium rosenbergii TaxID=79674 RepID=UPI0034D4E3AB